MTYSVQKEIQLLYRNIDLVLFSF